MPQNYVGNKERLLGLYRFPKLRAPRYVDAPWTQIKSVDMHLVERFPRPKLQIVCFMKDINPAPRLRTR